MPAKREPFPQKRCRIRGRFAGSQYVVALTRLPVPVTPVHNQVESAQLVLPDWRTSGGLVSSDWPLATGQAERPRRFPTELEREHASPLSAAKPQRNPPMPAHLPMSRKVAVSTRCKAIASECR